MKGVKTDFLTKKSSPTKEHSIDINFLEQAIETLREELINVKINETSSYKKWFNFFKLIYGPIHTNLKLYISFSLIFLTGIIFISNDYFRNRNKSLFLMKFSESILKIKSIVKNKYKKFELLNFDYFEPLIDFYDNSKNSSFKSLVVYVIEGLLALDIDIEYKFDYLYQILISSLIRHQSGEFYTPPFLVKNMVKETYNFGDSVLDPCCGSGNFLIEIIKRIKSSEKTQIQKITAFNNVFGYDINPISIFISKLNYIYLLKDYLENLIINLYVGDSLFELNKFPNKLFDQIIGNPPWYTLRDIEYAELQDKVKELADKLEIKPGPKNVLNIEIASLFFYKAKESYMRDNSKIFFVITKGVITGSHASRFRNFEGFNNIKIWSFSKKIEKIFNIEFICLYAEKNNIFRREMNIIPEFPEFHYDIRDDNKTISYFSDLNLILMNKNLLIPYHIEIKGNQRYTHKLIHKNLNSELLPFKTSCYKNLFHKGADLNPRNLIFMNPENEDNDNVKIKPDSEIFKKAKSPWNKIEFKNEIVEKKYIFKVIKSTELVKFHVYDYYNVFLPLSKTDLSFNYEKISPNAKKFYDKINNIYLKNKKETTKHSSLIDNLNRWSKLINKRQLSKIKVVYNNSGSTINSAVIDGDFLITGDLSFFNTDNLHEAYYLSAILNSFLLDKQIKIKKSSRHIFKIPFDTPIKKFDLKNQNHQKIAELGKKGHEIASKLIGDYKKCNKESFSKIKIQKLLIVKLENLLLKIDEILNSEFKL